MGKTSDIVKAALTATCFVGLVQAATETLLLAYLHADLVLAPSSFFSVQWHDAFTKLYSWAAPALPLPPLYSGFIGQGFVAKLAIGPSLLLANLTVAVALAPLFMVLAALSRNRIGPEQLGRRLVVAVVAAELVVNLTVWLCLGLERLPAEASNVVALRNLARDFVFDGTALTTVVLLVTAPLAWMAPYYLSPLCGRKGLAALVVTLALLPSAMQRLDVPMGQASGQAIPARPATLAPRAEGYNVILVSIDSLRADHLGCYGYFRDTSPAMDGLAAEGVLFANASSTTAWTLPGHMSMLTGRSLLGHGVIGDDRRLTADVATMAEVFQAAGYATAAVTSAPYVEAKYGFGRGFDHYDDHTISFATNGESYKSVTAPLLQETAEAWLNGHSNDPFFMFLHYWDVHYDYMPGAPYDTMFDPDYDGRVDGNNFYFNAAVHDGMDKKDLEHILALYDGEIRLVDDHIAMLRKTLDRLGLSARTIIVVTSDHGDEFFEHGRKGHHRTLYDEILRVPFILYLPGAEASRPRVGMESSIIDIMPTVLSLVGLPTPAGVEGVDLSEVAYGGQAEWERATVAELYRKRSLNVQLSVRRNGEKLIQHFDRRQAEVYSIATDPAEQIALPLSGQSARGLFGELKDWLNHTWPLFFARVSSQGVNSLEMDRETAERLRSLGYME